MHGEGRIKCMETVRFVFTSDKYLASYDRDEQRIASRSSYEISTFVFNIRFHDNPFRGIGVLLFTHMPRFNLA